MSYETPDRWEGTERECVDCGRSIRNASLMQMRCGNCENGVPLETSAEAATETGTRTYPLLAFSPGELAEYQATCRAFDQEQTAETKRTMTSEQYEEREIEEMPIIAKESGSNFKPAPAGAFAAVCCDVVDMGMKETEYAGVKSLKHKVRVVWQVADVDPATGKRPLVNQRYTLSLHEKSALRRDLQSWRGRTFTPSELQGFDVEKVVGVSCLLNIVHSADGQYANVSAIMPLPKGMAAPVVEGYVRDKDRPKTQPDPPDSLDGGEHYDPSHEPDGFGLDSDSPF